MQFNERGGDGSVSAKILTLTISLLMLKYRTCIHSNPNGASPIPQGAVASYHRYQSLRLWDVGLLSFNVFRVFFFLPLQKKKMPFSRCQTKVSVASDVAVRGQLGSKESHTKAPLNRH